jgi:hypothetical protein
MLYSDFEEISKKYYFTNTYVFTKPQIKWQMIVLSIEASEKLKDQKRFLFSART